jgi:hypothetical protein
MTMQWMSKRLVMALAAGATLVLAGCGTTGLTKETPAAQKEKVVAERANARWQALIKRDYEAAYAYMSPGSKSALSSDGFKNTAGQMVYRDAKVLGVTCEEELCSVKLSITYDHRVMKGVTTPLEERWILENGQMWYVWPL